MAISKDIQEDDDDTSPIPESPETSEINPPSDPPTEEPIISLNALTGFSAPQTLKLIGYIKHRKVIILVDSGSTHNFIHRPRNPLLYPCCENVEGAVKMCASK
jgi:hypothetical protein